MPGVIAVVTGELLAQHKLAWMPTLSGDTQAVLATDKVRFQGQEVACVIAETKYVAEDAAALIECRLRAAPGDHHPAAGARAGAPADPRREGGPDRQPDLPLGSGRQGRDRRGVRESRKGREPRDLLPALPSVAAGDLRHRGRRQPRDRQRDDVHDAPGAARTSHALRDRRRAARAEHPDHLPRHRRRLRQQGADLSRLRRRHRGIAAHRTSGEVGRGPHRQPHLDRVRPRLLHGRLGRDRREREVHRASRATCSATTAPSSRMRSRASSRPASSISSPARTTSRRRTSSPTAPTRTRRPVASLIAARSASPRRPT